MAMQLPKRMLSVIASLALLVSPHAALGQEEEASTDTAIAQADAPDEAANPTEDQTAGEAANGLDGSGPDTPREEEAAAAGEQRASEGSGSLIDLILGGFAIVFGLAIIVWIFMLGRKVSGLSDEVDNLSRSHGKLKQSHSETKHELGSLKHQHEQMMSAVQQEQQRLHNQAQARPAATAAPSAADRAPPAPSAPVERPKAATQVPTAALQGLIEAAKGMTQSEYRGKAGQIGEVHLINQSGDQLQIHQGEDDGDARDLLGIRLSPEKVAVIPSMQFIDRFDQSRSAKKSERIQPFFELDKSGNPTLELVEPCIAYDDDGTLRVEQRGHLTGFSD